MGSFGFGLTSRDISEWKSTGIYNHSSDSNMNVVADATPNLPNFKKFYPCNVLVNKCSGSCNTLDNPMTKLCIPNVIKRVNMHVYNFLVRLNETRNVLWHESCKCVCKLNSSVCNNKQIWNDDTCRCDCNEDFTDIISCAKGYTWNPSTCECQCDTWFKQGQYLDHKNCLCKNKLIGKLKNVLALLMKL